VSTHNNNLTVVSIFPGEIQCLAQPEMHFGTFINVGNGLPEIFTELDYSGKAHLRSTGGPRHSYHPKAAGSLHNSNHKCISSRNTTTGHKAPTLSTRPMQDPLRLVLAVTIGQFLAFTNEGTELDGTLDIYNCCKMDPRYFLEVK
jgi:hypothetical protein